MQLLGQCAAPGRSCGGLGRASREATWAARHTGHPPEHQAWCWSPEPWPLHAQDDKQPLLSGYEQVSHLQLWARSAQQGRATPRTWGLAPAQGSPGQCPHVCSGWHHSLRSRGLCLGTEQQREALLATRGLWPALGGRGAPLIPVKSGLSCRNLLYLQML